MTGMVSPLADGLLWSWLVPASLFAIAFGATWLLYRRFSRDGSSPR